MKILSLALTASLVCAPLQAQACATTSVQASAKVRELQSILMVGALQCRAVPGTSVVADYNRFIAVHRAALQNHNGALRAHFMQASGKAGASEFDRFTTRLANMHAQGASAAGFCDRIGAIVRAASDMPSSQLPDFSAEMLPESSACLKD